MAHTREPFRPESRFTERTQRFGSTPRRWPQVVDGGHVARRLAELAPVQHEYIVAAAAEIRWNSQKTILFNAYREGYLRDNSDYAARTLLCDVSTSNFEYLSQFFNTQMSKLQCEIPKPCLLLLNSQLLSQQQPACTMHHDPHILQFSVIHISATGR